ncbi:MAG TPA: ATP-binding protein [Chitinophagaceae bacterium]|nr:ATP-binding protein [Chitinophagaceae bacterium]
MKFYFTILLSMIFFGSVSGQQETFKDVDSLLRNLSQATTDTARIILKCKIGEAYRANKPDTSLLLANEALSRSTQVGFKKGEIHALIVLCVLYREKGDLPHALELGLKALKISEEEHYAYEQVYSLIRLSAVYFAVRDAPKAMTYLRKADEVLKKNYDDFQWSVTQYFLADGYEQLNKLDSAEKLVQMLEEKNGSDPTWIIINNRLRGSISIKRNEFPLAIEYFRKSNEAAIAETAFREAATAINAMAQVFKKLGQRDSAIFYAKEGLRLGEMLRYRNRILAASSLLAELYAEKDPSEAIKYYQIASAAKDSLYGVQKVQQLQSATMREQERQTELAAASLAYQNKMRQWALLGGAGAFLIIAVILFRNNRQKQRTNKVLETTLTNLKNTQSQLIQSEKMASLGELTAGIAHEIQNPLNFVNNFSELNTELIGEMKGEIEKGNIDEVKLIADSIEANEEKINHHGKRADAIVKGMLQHSRTSSGQKEPTDINALTDEYLRLAYHGLKAKDKSFNTSLKTYFDESIGNINIIPQDMGRVVLNLINNAFYAVDEKKRNASTSSAPNGYEPTVSVSTKRTNGKIEISVKDNGNGIPQKLLDKIFQPFFTTKPTGQGTGLGLSLAYDIIKAHGGELKVITREGEGSEFIIKLSSS